MSEHTPILHLDSVDRHGTTRARYGGRWIEVEHGIPGEKVRTEVVGKKRPRARITEVLDPSPDRVSPQCVYFRDWHCGGCQWQQISYKGQVQRKRAHVDEALRQQGLHCSLGAVHTPSDPWRYRATAGISLGKSAGFRRHGSLAIVPIRDCPICHPLLGRLMAMLNDRLQTGALPDFRGRVRLEVRLTQSGERENLQVLVHLSDDYFTQSDGEIDTLISVLASLAPIGGISILQPGSPLVTVHGDLFATTLIDTRPVSLAASSFFQTNTGLLPRLIQRIREEVEPLSRKRVADVYGGVGVFGLFLALGAQEVVIIESDPLAIEAGRRTAALWSLDNVTFRSEPAEEALSDIGNLDVVVIDPPRSGLSPRVIERILATRPPIIVYISCLAESLARDLAVLDAGGYRVGDVELFDFYPQTYHVELLAILRRSEMGISPE